MRLEVLEGVVEVKSVRNFVEMCKKFRATVQPISSQVVVSIRQIEVAVRKALEAFEKKENVSRELGMEILLYTVAKRNISKALEYGVKEGINELVFVILGEDNEVEEALSFLKSFVKEKKTLRIDEGKINKLKEVFEITDEELGAVGIEKLEDLVIERITLFHVFK
jgi:KEOPS complex subunit Cgi121